MKVRLSYTGPGLGTIPTITISGSKSESNRYIILQKLFPGIQLENFSDSADTFLMKKGVSGGEFIDVNHAGTAMRFLTAYYSMVDGCSLQITGSERMKERPIGILVNALRELGADIRYVKKKGFPPLQISGRELVGGKVSLDAGVSSQFISALMLIAPALSTGLTIELKGEVVSRSYIELTLGILNRIGVNCRVRDNVISIRPLSFKESRTFNIESDWSSASYWYSIVALSDDLSIKLKSFDRSSLQGDSIVFSIFEKLGVSTTFNSSDSSITLSKNDNDIPDIIQLDLIETPDLAQTLAVACFGMGVEAVLLGLNTLGIKETDRLEALKNELEKLGADVSIGSNSIRIVPAKKIKNDVVINTYNDHRMALSFAPLALKIPILIENPEVISKSYPSFWSHLDKAGFSLAFE
jgi:3-phosphoshikimate 1-carboxyvinyltransferase